MHISEALNFSFRALRSSPVRSFLTALGMMIGTASVILVVTISLTSQSYILEQIEGVGSNMIFAHYEIGTTQNMSDISGDFVKLADVDAVRQQLADRIVAATGVETSFDSLIVNGKEQRLEVIGSDEYYQQVRNLQVLAGRFLVTGDVQLREKVALLTEKLAKRLYGGQKEAVGNVIKVHGLQFTVVGTFKEKVESFGQSELNSETIVIPVTVERYFDRYERIDPLYVQVRNAADVDKVTLLVEQILESRHRAGAKYKVENLTAILDAARKIALALTIVLVVVSTVALVISGIGIMNIMLVTVTERTREIGLRMAVGASRQDILAQFLIEAVMLSISGGSFGIVVGLAIPLSVSLFVENLAIPISTTSVVVAFSVSCAVGLIFGILPANRASKLNPTEALRWE